MIEIARLEAFLFRMEVDTVVRMSFGSFSGRSAVVLRLEDRDGAVGWGEVWCNFPAFGAENKFKLLQTVVGPAFLAASDRSPAAAFHRISASLHRMSLQTGEIGPIAACIAGIDLALWDLASRKAGQPLARYLGAKSLPADLPAYASGVNPDGAAERIAELRDGGFDAFKLKVGFGPETDFANVERIIDSLRSGERFMVDANQAWDIAEARIAIDALNGAGLGWIEEPIPVDRPAAEWAELAALSAAPLAGGENMLGFEMFDRAVNAGHLGVIQPDICKWGGVTGCFAVARRAVGAGRVYCPHWLAGGLGLAAAAHVLAAVGGPGMLEHDSNPNPFRALLGHPLPQVENGRFALPQGPGLGVAPDMANLQDALVERFELTPTN